jgi:hypothetical protein
MAIKSGGPNLNFVFAFVVGLAALTPSRASAAFACRDLFLPVKVAQAKANAVDALKEAIHQGRDVTGFAFVRKQITLIEARLSHQIETQRQFIEGLPSASTRAQWTLDSLLSIRERLGHEMTNEQFNQLAYEFSFASSHAVSDVTSQSGVRPDSDLVAMAEKQMRELPLALKSLAQKNRLVIMVVAEPLSLRKMLVYLAHGIVPLGVSLKDSERVDGQFFTPALFIYHDLAHTLRMFSHLYSSDAEEQSLKTLSYRRNVPSDVAWTTISSKLKSLITEIDSLQDSVFKGQLYWLTFTFLHERYNLDFFYSSKNLENRFNDPATGKLDPAKKTEFIRLLSNSFNFNKTADPTLVQAVPLKGKSWNEALNKFIELSRQSEH